jgi:hypothetical protein
MEQKFFEDFDKNQEFLKYLDNRFEAFKTEIDGKIKANLRCNEAAIKGKINVKLLGHLLEELGDLKTLEYYLDKDLHKISRTALKKAMSEKSTPYVPL